MRRLTVVGGGLAGSEAAWQAAQQGIEVDLFEMRPNIKTGAHHTADLAEMICSNSLGSNLIDRASGLIKEEARIMGSLLIKCAEATSIPAGSALAVDRDKFSAQVTQFVSNHSCIRIIREEVTHIPETPCIIASGPLTSPKLAEAIQKETGEDEELRSAEKIPLKDTEAVIKSGVKAGAGGLFEGCLPVETIAERGANSLAFGPMRPTGLKNPRTGKWPFAVVQLRQDNLIGSMYNLVGFQTNLTYSEQKRIFRLIPGLENAEFARYGQMHRNTFLCSPLLLNRTLQCRKNQYLFFAGQIIGLEGYIGNIASGLLAGLNAARFLKEEPLIELPITTMLGALCNYITQTHIQDFQPMKANFGVFPEPSERFLTKREKARFLTEHALQDLKSYLSNVPN